MADTMQFDLVSPERRLVSVEVREVRMPGTEGDMTAMPGHSATMLTLRPGIVTTVNSEGQETEYAVTGGFAEVNGTSVSLLAEQGRARADMTQDIFNEMMAEAQRRKKAVDEKPESFGEEAVEAMVKLLSDMEAMGSHIGLDPKQASVPD